MNSTHAIKLHAALEAISKQGLSAEQCRDTAKTVLSQLDAPTAIGRGKYSFQIGEDGEYEIFYAGKRVGEIFYYADAVRINDALLGKTTSVAQTNGQQDSAAGLLNKDEMACFKRFYECALDGDGYDVSNEMMQRLAEIGVVRRTSNAHYETTKFGLFIIDNALTEEQAHTETVGAVIGYLDPMSLLNFQSGRSNKEWLWAKGETGNIPVYAEPRWVAKAQKVSADAATSSTTVVSKDPAVSWLEGWYAGLLFSRVKKPGLNPVDGSVSHDANLEMTLEPTAWFCVNNITGKMCYTDSREASAEMRDQQQGHWVVTPLFAGPLEQAGAPVPWSKKSS